MSGDFLYQRFFVMSIILLLQFFDTVGTNVFPFEHKDIFCVAAKGTAWFILLENNRIIIYINFQCVLFRDVKRAAQLDREYDPAYSSTFLTIPVDFILQFSFQNNS